MRESIPVRLKDNRVKARVQAMMVCGGESEERADVKVLRSSNILGPRSRSSGGQSQAI
jgi:hypothetical protein